MERRELLSVAAGIGSVGLVAGSRGAAAETTAPDRTQGGRVSDDGSTVRIDVVVRE